jgi:PAS domain-containing protein
VTTAVERRRRADDARARDRRRRVGVRQEILAERSMRQDLYRTIVEEGPVVTYIDAPDEVASSVYVSPQIERVVGYTVEEWMADPELWPGCLHPTTARARSPRTSGTTRRASPYRSSTG